MTSGSMILISILPAVARTCNAVCMCIVLSIHVCQFNCQLSVISGNGWEVGSVVYYITQILKLNHKNDRKVYDLQIWTA